MDEIKKSVSVNASREAVWNAIKSYRQAEPGKRKTLSDDEGRAVIEESFGGVPVIGSSRVVYEEVETLHERIDYRLVRSEIISKFEGSWKLTEEGSKTSVELTTTIDIAIAVPFKDKLLVGQAEQDMDRRLKYVKEKAESAAD